MLITLSMMDNKISFKHVKFFSRVHLSQSQFLRPYICSCLIVHYKNHLLQLRKISKIPTESLTVLPEIHTSAGTEAAHVADVKNKLPLRSKTVFKCFVIYSRTLI